MDESKLSTLLSTPVALVQILEYSDISADIFCWVRSFLYDPRKKIYMCASVTLDKKETAALTLLRSWQRVWDTQILEPHTWPWVCIELWLFHWCRRKNSAIDPKLKRHQVHGKYIYFHWCAFILHPHSKTIGEIVTAALSEVDLLKLLFSCWKEG